MRPPPPIMGEPEILPLIPPLLGVRGPLNVFLLVALSNEGSNQMPIQTPPQDELEKLSAQGHAIYNNTLRTILEPQFNGQTVAIHPDSGDYEVARNSPRARRGLHARQSQGFILTTNIGLAGMDSLTLRMIAGQWLAGDSQ